MPKGGFVFYETFLETANKLEAVDKEAALEFYKAVANYGLYGEIYEGNPYVEIAMVQVKANIDIAKNRYQTAIENGMKGGRPREIDYKEIGRLHKEGKTNKEIAGLLNCSESTVSRVLNSQREWALQNCKTQA